MKKFLLVIVALFCVSTAYAKETVDVAKNSRYAVGLRLGTGGELVAECFYGNDVYVEGRLGIGWGSGFNFTALHAWNPYNWNWTPNVGSWFFDCGVGAFVGGAKGSAHFGVAGMAKFGIEFKKVPIRLAIDVTPHVGVVSVAEHGMSFFGSGLFNAGLSATWRF